MLRIFVSALIAFSFSVQAEEGIASWYGRENHTSSSGKKLNHNTPAAAHRTLPLGSRVRVTSTRTKKSVVVVIEDRGPYKKQRIIDVNKSAALSLGMVKSGTARVIVEKL